MTAPELHVANQRHRRCQEQGLEAPSALDLRCGVRQVVSEELEEPLPDRRAAGQSSLALPSATATPNPWQRAQKQQRKIESLGQATGYCTTVCLLC